VTRDGAAWRVAIVDTVEPADAMAQVAETVRAARVEVHRPTLEDIFVEIVAGREEATEEAARLRAELRADAALLGGNDRR
jgi:hypothetical protein